MESEDTIARSTIIFAGNNESPKGYQAPISQKKGFDEEFGFQDEDEGTKLKIDFGNHLRQILFQVLINDWISTLFLYIFRRVYGSY